MTEVSAANVKVLREKTGAGMMDCKNALKECDNNIEAATDYLRKKGLAAASKKTDRVASEGLIGCYKHGNQGTLVELNSETDFVSRNEKFQSLVARLAEAAAPFTGDVNAMKSSTPPSFKRSVSEEIVEHIAVIGENINLRRIATLKVDHGVIISYVHNSVIKDLGKIGVLVALESNADAAVLSERAKQLAMHVASSRPDVLNISDLDPTTVAYEREIFKAQSIESGKSPEVAEKMVEGRVRKYYEEVVFMEQPFFIDPKITVRGWIEALAADLGSPITVSGYVRFALGEGIEKGE